MILDLAAVSGMVALALSTLNLFGLLRNMFTSGERKLDERVAKVESKLIEHDRRVQAVENEMKHLPDRDTAHKLEIAMERIAGRLDAMDERLRPIANTNHRLQEFLLEQAQK